MNKLVLITFALVLVLVASVTAGRGMHKCEESKLPEMKAKFDEMNKKIQAATTCADMKTAFGRGKKGGPGAPPPTEGEAAPAPADQPLPASA